MMIALGTGPLSAAASRVGGGGAPPPAATFDTIVIEGDSIASNVPTTPNGSFAYQYADSRPDKAIAVRAQGSRTIGTSSQLDDNGNTLFGNVAEDAAFAPDVIAFKIGANDLTTGTGPGYRANLIALRAAYAAERPAMKIAWSPPIAYNPTGTPHPSKGNFDTQRASLLADCRDPAVWGQWADYYNPIGEHPDFADPAVAAPLFGDAVHPSAAGQNALHLAFRAFMDSLLDSSRVNSAAMFDSAWPGNETALAAGNTIARRIYVSGLKHTGHDGGVSVSGAGSPSVKVNGATPSSRVYNGDIVDLTLTLSASFLTDTAVNLTIGGETRTLTYRTAANVAPVTAIYGGHNGQSVPGTTMTYAGKPFDTGIAVLALLASSTGGNAGSVTVGGTAATLIRTDGSLQLWYCPVAAGDRDIIITRPAGYIARHSLQWVTLRNAAAAPSVHGGAGGSYDTPPFATPSLAVPANGLLIGVLGFETGATEPTIAGGNGDLMLGQGSNLFQSSRTGTAMAARSATGSVGFQDGSGWGNLHRSAVVFGAA